MKLPVHSVYEIRPDACPLGRSACVSMKTTYAPDTVVMALPNGETVWTDEAQKVTRCEFAGEVTPREVPGSVACRYEGGR